MTEKAHFFSVDVADAMLNELRHYILRLIAFLNYQSHSSHEIESFFASRCEVT